MTLRHEELLGPFDGVQTQFSTQSDYVSGSVRAFLPLLEQQANVTELGGRDVELAEAPLQGDVVFLVYRSIQ